MPCQVARATLRCIYLDARDDSWYTAFHAGGYGRASSATIRGLALIIQCVDLQAPRVAQTAIMSAVFFTLFEVSPDCMPLLAIIVYASCPKGSTRWPSAACPSLPQILQAWKAALKRDRQPEDKRLNVKMWRKRRSHGAHFRTICAVHCLYAIFAALGARRRRLLICA